MELKLKPSDVVWIKEMRAAGNSIWHCKKCNDLRAIPLYHPRIKIPKKWNCKGCGRFLKKIKEGD